MYDGWVVTRWDTPVSDVAELYLASLTDARRELTLVLEGPLASGRPRWRVEFQDYPGYRNLDEAFRVELWQWLDMSGQRCGSTFVVSEPLPLASWATSGLHQLYPGLRHYVVATMDDVIEVLAAREPSWTVVEPAGLRDPPPGKSTHLFLGRDDDAIARLEQEIKSRERRH
jgi:hypothetical protein